jgi:hypothetical protein
MASNFRIWPSADQRRCQVGFLTQGRSDEERVLGPAARQGPDNRA